MGKCELWFDCEWNWRCTRREIYPCQPSYAYLVLSNILTVSVLDQRICITLYFVSLLLYDEADKRFAGQSQFSSTILKDVTYFFCSRALFLVVCILIDLREQRTGQLRHCQAYSWIVRVEDEHADPRYLKKGNVHLSTCLVRCSNYFGFVNQLWRHVAQYGLSDVTAG